MRKRSRPRPSFVITVAVAAVASACGGNATSDGGSGTGGSAGTGGTGASGGTGGQPGCPIAPPDLGTSCVSPELTCDYVLCKPPSWQSDITVQCIGGQWASWGISSCNPPPPPQCPMSQPQTGTACPEDGMYCTYGDSACCPPAEAKCVGGQWEVLITSCNPPPPPPCPANVPANGTSCSTGDPCAPNYQTCDYDWCSTGGPAYSATCDGSTWTVKKNCEPGPG